MCIFYAIKAKGNKVRMNFVTFPDSGLSGVDDVSIQTQRAVKGLFDMAKKQCMQSLVLFNCHLPFADKINTRS